MSYIVADEPNLWDHVFEEDTGAVNRACKFVFDPDSRELLAAQVHYDGAWVDAGCSTLTDLEDSLFQANAEALENPSKYGLVETDVAPDWSGISAAPAP